MINGLIKEKIALGDRVDRGEASRPLRVLLLPPQAWGPEQGADKDAPDFASMFTELSLRGIDVELLNPCDRPFNPFAGRHALYQGFDPFRSLRVLLSERHYDLIMTTGESPTILLLLLRKVFRFRVPIIAVDMALAEGWPLRDKFLSFAVPKLDGAVVLSQNQIGYLEEHWPTRARVRFIPLQVDTKFFLPGQTSPNGPILTIGDDGARDFPTLLRALDGLDVDLVAKTRQLSAAPTGLPRVQVISDRMRWPDYRALIASARFVVVPLVAVPHASGVNSVLEAMAMGKAVITCDSPGIRDYAIADRTALVVPCGDAEAMRSAILRLMTDDVLCERLGRCARQFVEQHCSYASVAEQTAAFVREVVESHRS